MNPAIDKIRKLLRLAKDRAASPAEAASAMAKAQQIAAENSISLTEIPDDCDPSNSLTHVTTKSQAGLPHCLAAQAVKRHFGVATIFDPNGAHASIHIIGTPLQAELATYVYVYLVRVLRQAWLKRANRRLRDRESFLRGFAVAIREQLPEVFPQDGLILSSKAYIEQQIIGPNGRIREIGGKPKPLADSSFINGYRAGKKAGIRNAIPGTPAQRQLAL